MSTTAIQLLKSAEKGHYAVGQFNVNNLEWVKAIFAAAEALRAPVILGVTQAAAQYMGGLLCVRDLVFNMARHLRVTIPY